LLWFPHGDETSAESARHGRRKEVTASFDADDDIDGRFTIVLLQSIDGVAKSLLVFQQRSDVVEVDAGFRKIGDFTDQLLEMVLCGRRGRCFCGHAAILARARRQTVTGWRVGDCGTTEMTQRAIPLDANSSH